MRSFLTLIILLVCLKTVKLFPIIETPIEPEKDPLIKSHPLKDILEQGSGLAICKYTTEEFKKAPMLLIYCIFLSIGWILIIFHYITTNIKKLLQKNNGQSNNRENPTLNMRETTL